MKRTRFLTGLLMALLFCMCTSPKQKMGEGLPTFDVADALNAALPDTFTWNSIAKNARMIPLKTEHLIGGMPIVQFFSDDLIIVSDFDTKRIFLFDGEGREKVSFSHYGQGPKEYLYMTKVNYHEKDSLIMLYDGGKKKLFRFDLEGKFVDARPMDTGGTVLKIDTEGTMFSVNQTGESFISIWDDKLELKGECLPFDTCFNDRQKIGFQMLSGKGFIGSEFKVLPATGDTVYSITKEGAHPVCVLDRGRYKCVTEKLGDDRMLSNPDYLIGESLSFFSSYFYYLANSKTVAELWDMNTGKLLAWNRGVQGSSEYDWIWGFRYVFPSGNEIRPNRFDYVTKNRGIFILQADECLDDVEGLNADDNPVLLVLEF